MVRKIAGHTKDRRFRDLARDFAAAELDVARVRRTKVALIERVRAHGALERPGLFRSVADLRRYFAALDRGILFEPEYIDPAETMPPQEPYRTAEAIRRLLSELLKLNRYEQHASRRRDQAVRELANLGAAATT